MKSILTIRGNLLLINVVVIGLILWLTISFLNLAVSQRNDAARMQESISIERSIFRTNTRLVRERDLVFDLLHVLDAPGRELTRPLDAAFRASDDMLEAIIVQVKAQLAKQPGTTYLPSTLHILQQQLSTLQTYKAELSEHRAAALAQSVLPTAKRDRTDSNELFVKQADTLNTLAKLAGHFRLLPDARSVAISHYNDLISDILLLDVQLARMSALFNEAALRGSEAVSDESLNIAVLDKQIAQGLNELVLNAQTTAQSSVLTPIAIETRRLYRHNHLRIGAGLGAEPSSHSVKMGSWSELHQELAAVSRSTAKLAEATHSSLEVLVGGFAARAYRNLVIDICLVILCLAITAVSAALNRRLKSYAFHDSLTRLQNRRSFESAIAASSASGAQMQAVIFIDLDRFKSINDNYGHAVGDRLLLEVAARLKAMCKRSYILARLGGDEFAIYMDNVASELEVETMASDIVNAIEDNYVINDLSLNVGASAGVSISPIDCKCGIELLRNADIAMYYSKANKVSSIYRFNQSMADSYHQRLELEADLRKGIENDQFHLVYQPKVCTDSSHTYSVEALLRWTHPELGMISPAQFVPLAEDNGLMGTIGDWVLSEACREIAYLQANSPHRVQVAVNISAQQFGDPAFVDNVIGTLRKHNLEPHYLQLEVTESIVMSDVARVILMLDRLKESGVSIAIDDFGTGYSSLQYLQKLPLDVLKIDRAFITELDNIDPDTSVANSIIQLAKLFNLETVAEGVETQDQDRKIRSLGVHFIQGFLYSRPVPAIELPDVLHRLNVQQQAA